MTALLNKTLARLLLAAGLACALVSAPARAQSEASAALSLLPVASVVGTASVGAAASGAVVALPAALSVAGAVLTVKSIEASAVGTVVTCSVIGTGVLLSVAGEVLAFVPNALGRALLHNERL